jgi:hypothetical protein
MKKAKGGGGGGKAKAKAGGRVTPKGTKPSTVKPPPFTIPGVGDDSFPGLN